MASLIGAAGLTVLLAAVFVSRAPADNDLQLPDLDQELPTEVGARAVEGGYALGFDSAVVNKGPGPLRVVGARLSGQDHMVADQLVLDSAGAWRPVPNVGRLQYVDAFGHEHWHFMQFQRYELHSAADPGRILGDRKQGFCLADSYAPGWCAQGDRDRQSIEEGLSPGARDAYHRFVEGQEIVIDRATTPSGTYVLVNRTDVVRDGAVNLVQEVTTANNAASVRLELKWPSSGSAAPRVKVTRKCPDSAQCAAESGAPTAQVAPPAPVTPPSPPPRATRLRRPEAASVARRALRHAFGRIPRRIGVNCARRNRVRLVCRAAWRRAGDSHRARLTIWRGRHATYYRLRVVVKSRHCSGGAARCTRRVSAGGRSALAPRA